MKITIQYFDGCPNWRLAEQRVRQAMTDLGRADLEIAYEVIASPDAAEQLNFHGSPTIVVNGHDAFGGPDTPLSFGCRVYATEEGTQGAPSVAQLRHVLQSVAS